MTYKSITVQRSAILLVVVAGVFPSIAKSHTAGGARSGAPPVVEEGKFRLHKFEQAIGEETYRITKDGSNLAVKADFKFKDRGTDVPLEASFHGKNDWTP